MKNNKILIIIAVIFMNLLSVILVGQEILNGNSEYENALAKANELADASLCSQAVDAYKEALEKKDTIEVREKLLETYEAGIDSGELTEQYDIFTAVINMVEGEYSENAKMYELACNFLAKYEQYDDCVELLNKAKSLKLQSEELDGTLESIRYMYERKYSMYTNVYPEYNGVYLVEDDGEYRFLDSDASSGVARRLTYATPFSEGYSLVKSISPDSKESTYIINSEGIRQVYFDNTVKSSTGVGKCTTGKNGEESVYLLACQVNGRYKYYNIKAEEQFGDYLFAGRFRNNVAAVEIEEGQWKFINCEGGYVSDKVYSDVILNEFYDCAPKGLIFAAENGKYHLYDKTLQQIGNFSCDGAKAFVDDGYAAFRQGEKWGFVDSTGKVMIEPQYEDAKSFSNGVAAVCQNGVWNFINTKGEVVIQGDYEDAGYMSSSGVCFVKDEGYWSSLQMYYVEKVETK